MTDAPRCEVCRRPGSQDYAPGHEGHPGAPRGVLCVACAVDVRRVEDHIVRYRRVLAYIKRWAPRSGPKT